MGVGAVLGGLGLASSIGGQVAAGGSRLSQAKNEAKATLEAAKQEVVSTEFEIGMIREQAARTVGAQTAGYGRGGVVLEGSPLRQLVETTQRAEQDVFWKKQNLEHRLEMIKRKGSAAVNEGRAAAIGTGFGAAGTLFSGLTKLPGVF